MRQSSLLVTAVLLCTGAAVHADVQILERRDADRMAGPGGVVTGGPNQRIRTVVGEKAVRRDQGSTSAILRLDERKLYLLYHDSKSYSVASLPIDREALLSAELRAGRQAMRPEDRQLVDDIKRIHAEVTPLAESASTAVGDCQRFSVGLATMQRQLATMDVCASTQVKPEVREHVVALWRELARLGDSGTERIEAIAALGLPLSIDARIYLPSDEVHSEQRVVAIREIEPDADLFRVPADYVLVLFDLAQAQARLTLFY